MKASVSVRRVAKTSESPIIRLHHRGRGALPYEAEMKSAKPKKPRRSLFLLAAKRMHETSLETDRWRTITLGGGYCCNMFYHGALPEFSTGEIRAARTYFIDKFSPPKNFSQRVWWGCLPGGGHDYESRIYALLLCAEMLR